MARTVQAVLDRAREILNDKAGTRYLDDELCNYVRDAMVDARYIRPDLFVGVYLTPLPDTLVPSDPFPLSDQFFAVVGEYLVGMAELRDDEWAVDGRAATLRSTLKQKLTTGM
jgi:hypothetical protein